MVPLLPTHEVPGTHTIVSAQQSGETVLRPTIKEISLAKHILDVHEHSS